MFRALESPLQADLRPFSRHLAQHHVPHRITERGGIQELWVSSQQAANMVRVLYTAFVNGQSGEPAEEADPVLRHSALCELSALLQRFPLTILLVFAAVVVAATTQLGDHHQAVRFLTIVEFEVLGDRIVYLGLDSLLDTQAWWRLWSPMLLHFNIAHLVFNLVWIWVLGTRIEVLQSKRHLIFLVLATALISNLGEYLMSGPLFGGYSGVVFGLLGYVWLTERLNPYLRFGLPPQLMGLMLAWLVLGYTGLLGRLGLGEIANTAHTLGLLSGLVIAAVFALVAPGRQKAL